MKKKKKNERGKREKMCIFYFSENLIRFSRKRVYETSGGWWKDWEEKIVLEFYVKVLFLWKRELNFYKM